jgi:hypothetical protein
MKKLLAYFVKHRSAILVTIVTLQNAGLISDKIGGLLVSVVGS